MIACTFVNGFSCTFSNGFGGMIFFLGILALIFFAAWAAGKSGW